MDRFIDAVGEYDLCRRETEVSGDETFNGLAFWIAREITGGDVAKHFAHLGRTGKRVLVEVETKRITAAERRMIFLHLLNAQARKRRRKLWRDQSSGLLAKRVRMDSA